MEDTMQAKRFAECSRSGRVATLKAIHAELCEMQADIHEDFVWSFSSQAGQYPETGDPGIGYFRGDLSEVQEGWYVDCLLFRDADGKVIGILNHYPFDMGYVEQAGNFLVVVHPNYRHQGIATALVSEALKRWDDINLLAQTYSTAGLPFIREFVKRWIIKEEGAL